eukprot:2720187-Rhodomonas_salina.1
MSVQEIGYVSTGDRLCQYGASATAYGMGLRAKRRVPSGQPPSLAAQLAPLSLSTAAPSSSPPPPAPRSLAPSSGTGPPSLAPASLSSCAPRARISTEPKSAPSPNQY